MTPTRRPSEAPKKKTVPRQAGDEWRAEDGRRGQDRAVDDGARRQEDLRRPAQGEPEGLVADDVVAMVPPEASFDKVAYYCCRLLNLFVYYGDPATFSNSAAVAWHDDRRHLARCSRASK